MATTIEKANPLFGKAAAWLMPVLFAVILFAQEYVRPQVGDSLEYSFLVPAGPDDNGYRPISSIGDLIESQSNHYMFENGRVVVHSLIQPLCAIEPRWGFALLNALVYLLLTWLTLRLLKWGATAANLLLVSAITLLYVLPINPDIAYQVNYLWVSTLIAGFMVVFFQCRCRRWPTWPLLLLLGFATGESNEAFSAGIALALTVYFVRRYRRITVAQKLLTVAFIVGLCVNVLAPGNQVKLSTFKASSALGALLNLLTNNWYIAVLVIILLVRRRHGFSLRRYFHDYTFVIVSFCGQWVLLWIMGTAYFNACLGLRWLLAILVLGALSGVKPKLWWETALTLVCLVSGAYYVLLSYDEGLKYSYLEEQYMQSATGRVLLPGQHMSKDYRRTRLWAHPLTWKRRAMDRNAPEIEVIPEGLDRIPPQRDTNAMWQLNSNTFVVVQSRRHPQPFYLVKRLPYAHGPVFGVRDIRLNPEDGIDFWMETEAWRAGVYHNNLPLLFNAEVTDKLPEGK